MTSTTENNLISFESSLSEISSGLVAAADGLARAARAYVAAIDADPVFRTWVSERLPSVSGTMWRRLEAAGRGLLDHRVLAGVPFGHLIAKLPLSEQRAVLDGPTEVLLPDGDILRVSLDSMTQKQAAQVFGADHLRTPSQQRAWLESRRVVVMPEKPAEQVIEVDKRRRRIVVGGIPLSYADLLDYLRKLGE